MYKRRKFIATTGKIVGGLLLPKVALSNAAIPAHLTVQDVIDIILKEVPGAPFAKTVDQLRSGQLTQNVTGVVTTMFPTIEVIKKTAAIGANFIIAHETPFYNNEDETDWLQQDEAYLYKQSLLHKHQIAIWRFHDYWHAHKPDGIIMGNLIKLGWEKYFDSADPRLLKLPNPVKLSSIVDHAKKQLGIPTVRVLGNLQSTCSTIYLAFGYMDSKRQIAAIKQYKPDLILSGETREWETVERVRDGQQMEHKTNLLVLGHAVSEEAGMAYAASWLQPKIPGTKITHIPSKNPFQFV